MGKAPYKVRNIIIEADSKAEAYAILAQRIHETDRVEYCYRKHWHEYTFQVTFGYYA